MSGSEVNDSEVKAQTELKPQDVAGFLEQNPEFFVGRDDLLLGMTLPHQRGDTISLVERQMALLREGNINYRSRLDGLSETAKENERLFEQMRKLVLALLESRDLEQLLETITDSLNHEFNIEFHSLILFSEQPLNLPVRVESVDAATLALGAIVSKNKPVCGQFTHEQLRFLFAEREESVGSSAIIPLSYSLNNPQQLGVLALASKDSRHFHEGVGALFVGYLGDVLSRVLAHHMPREPEQ